MPLLADRVSHQNGDAVSKSGTGEVDGQVEEEVLIKGGKRLHERIEEEREQKRSEHNRGQVAKTLADVIPTYISRKTLAMRLLTRALDFVRFSR